jgi:FkbM family methyltransferase
MPYRCFALLALLLLSATVAAAGEPAPYESCPYPSRDGIGKCYMGREIAQVMGHQGADWLERPQREEEERPSVVIRNLELQPDHTVADIGAGTGYFAFRIAPLVPRGSVLAVDIQPEMLQIMERRKRESGVGNVQTVLGAVDDPKLPEHGVDLVLLVDVYHEFSHPREMMTAIVRALRPGGRVALVEYRAEDRNVPIKRLHKMSQSQAIREMAAVGLRHMQTRDVLPWQHLMFFEREP